VIVNAVAAMAAVNSRIRCAFDVMRDLRMKGHFRYPPRER
jgi:hypothetical protein